MRLPILPTLLILPLTALAAPALAQTIGLAAPLTGPRGILAEQMQAGAAAAVAGTGARIIEADTACTAAGGAAAAAAFVAAEVEIVAGFLCTASLEAALPILGQAGIPTIVVGVRAERILADRDRSGHMVWRLGPGSGAEADALAAFVAKEWRDDPFGIVEDGSTPARDLADELRTRLGAVPLEPALVDHYRPAEDRQFALGRRIAQSGVTRIVLLGSRPDAAIVLRDAAELGLDLEIVGGEAFLDAETGDVELPDGTHAVGVPEMLGGDGEPAVEGYALPTRAAVEIAAEVVRRAGASARSFADILDTERFSTVLGEIGFPSDGQSDWQALKPLRFDGQAFAPIPENPRQ